MSPDQMFSARAQDLIEAGRVLDSRGMVPATSGNLSARIDEARIAVTVSGSHKGRLLEKDIMSVDMQGNATNRRKPSAETLLHLQIYQRYPEAHFILHPHSANATVLSRMISDALVLEGYELLKAFTGISSHESRILVPNFRNDQDIARLSQKIDTWMDHYEGPVFGYLISGHGFYTWGTSMEETLRHLEALEFLFQCELKSIEAKRR